MRAVEWHFNMLKSFCSQDATAHTMIRMTTTIQFTGPQLNDPFNWDKEESKMDDDKDCFEVNVMATSNVDPPVQRVH